MTAVAVSCVLLMVPAPLAVPTPLSGSFVTALTTMSISVWRSGAAAILGAAARFTADGVTG